MNKRVFAKITVTVFYKNDIIYDQCPNVNTTLNADQRCTDITFSDPEPICIRNIRLEYVIIVAASNLKFRLQVIKLSSITNYQHQFGHGYGQS